MRILFFIIFIDSLGWGIAYPVFEAFFVEDKIGIMHLISNTDRNTYFVFILSLFCFLEFISAPVLGALSDRIGQKYIIISSLLGGMISACVSIIGVYYHSIFLLSLSRGLAGLTAGNWSVIQAAVINKSPSDRLSANLNVMTLATTIGFIIGPLIGSQLLNMPFISQINLFTPFLLMFLLSGLAIGLLWSYKEEYSSKLTLNMNAFLKSTLLGYCKILLKKQTIRQYILVLTCYMIARIMFFTELPIIFHLRYATSNVNIGVLLGYFAFILAVGSLFIYPLLLKWLDLEKLITASLAIQIISYLIFMVSPNETVSCLVLIPIALTVSIIYTSVISLISIQCRDTQQGLLMGLVASLMSLSWGIGPLTAGLMMYGGENCFFVAVVLLTINSLVMFSKCSQYVPSEEKI
jgi:DHA1 family tetracycline resistance protein-like MFS transporter